MRRIRTFAVLTAVVMGSMAAALLLGRGPYRAVPPTGNNGFAAPSHVPRAEPAYQSPAPKYARIALGPDSQRRVWLVFDSVPDPLMPDGGQDYLYVDLDADGDLTQSGERFEAVVHEREMPSFLGRVESTKIYHLQFKIPSLRDSAGREYKNLDVGVGWLSQGRRYCTVSCVTSLGIRQYTELHQLEFADKPENAPVIHFGGPLTMRFALGSPYPLSLSQPTKLQVEVGTPGVGAGTFASLDNESFPKDLHPIAQVEFPHREAGKPPIPVTVVLNGRC